MHGLDGAKDARSSASTCLTVHSELAPAPLGHTPEPFAQRTSKDRQDDPPWGADGASSSPDGFLAQKIDATVLHMMADFSAGHGQQHLHKLFSSQLMNLLHTLTQKLQHHRAGLVLLRTYLAVATLLHGIAKLQHGIQGMVTASGLPAFFAYGVLLGEVVAPALLLVGLLVTPAALVIAFNMVVAILFAHSSQLLSLGKTGGWAIELQMFFLVTALVVVVTHQASRSKLAVPAD